MKRYLALLTLGLSAFVVSSSALADTINVNLGIALGKSMAYKMLQLSPQNYADWSSGHSLTGGQTDDDDNDGVDNLGEFYAGTDPTSVTSMTRPTPSIETIDGMEYLTLSFPRNLNALGFQGIAQVSEDLTNWNNGTAPVFIDSVKNNDGTSTIKYRAPWDLSDISHPRIFLRLQITP